MKILLRLLMVLSILAFFVEVIIRIILSPIEFIFFGKCMFSKGNIPLTIQLYTWAQYYKDNLN